jgi:hypothetical protein
MVSEHNIMGHKEPFISVLRMQTACTHSNFVLQVENSFMKEISTGNLLTAAQNRVPNEEIKSHSLDPEASVSCP